MSFLEGFLVARAVLPRARYRRASAGEAWLAYPGGVLLGLGALLAFTSEAACGLGILLAFVGGLMIALSPLARE